MPKFSLQSARFQILGILLVLAMLFQTACGTLLHPERRGQTSGKIDPSIAILNGIGLLLFIVPGLIAFAVDFSTGAIYLPPGESAGSNDNHNSEQRVVHINPDEITPEKLASVIYEHTGVEVTLTEQDMRVLQQQNPETVAAELANLTRTN